MANPYFQLRRQVREWLDEYKCSQARLSKTLGFSEGLLSDFINGQVGLSVANFAKLNAYTSAPWLNQNAGARFVNCQRYGQPAPDVLLDGDSMETVEELHNKQVSQAMNASHTNRNGSTFAGRDGDQKELTKNL